MGGYVIESNINVPVQKFVSDSALFSLRWLNVPKCQYSRCTALSVLSTTHHSTPAQNDIVGWVLSCCTRDVFNTDELESTYRCTGKTVLGRAPTTVLGNLYLGEHLPLYWGNCTQVSAYHCTGKSVLGREPAIVLGNMYLGKHLPLYWKTVLGRAPTTVLEKLYLGEHLPLYWERRG